MQEKPKISAENLKRYQSGKMSHSEMNQVEKTLLKDSFLSEANDGFEAIKKDKINLENNLSDLKQKLKTRTQKEVVFQPKNRSPFTVFRYTAIAASVLIFVFAGIYFFNKDSENQTISLKAESKNDSEIDSIISFEKKQTFENSKKKIEKIDKIEALKEKQPILKTEPESSSYALNEATPLQESETLEEVVVSKPSAKSAPQASEIIDKKVDSDDTKATQPKEQKPSKLSSSNISGTVVDEEKKPIEGVGVNLKGTSKGVKTNAEGKFYFEGLKKGDILVLNYFNQEPKEVLIKNSYVGTITLGEDLPIIPNQPKVKIIHSADLEKDKKYTEAKPEFGQNAFDIYIKENLRKPLKAIENKVSGRVMVEFKVDTTGDVSDFKIIRSLGYGCDEETIRLIREGQKWFPAQRYGEKEISRKRVSVKF